MTTNVVLSPDQAEVLQTLGFLYLQHGQLGRSLALLVLADRCRPNDTSIKKTLALAYLKNQEPIRALKVVEQLEQATGIVNPSSPLQLLKAQAQWLCGEKDQARKNFKRFTEARRRGRQVVRMQSEQGTIERQRAVS